MLALITGYLATSPPLSPFSKEGGGK